MNTVKHVSEAPPANAVSAPNDPNAQRNSTARALQAYGVLKAFREGYYPSNRQIDSTLDYALDNSPIETAKLSKDGKMLIRDFQNIIRTAKEIVRTKNEDELFQNFLYHTRHVDTGKGNLSDVNTPVGKGDMKNDADQAAEHLRTLGKLIFTNSEARKLLKDVGLLGRDVAADAAAKASEKARPADHELANVDEPAPSNQWVGPDGETRDHRSSVPDTGLGAKKEAAKQKKEDLKAEAKEEADASQQRVQDRADEAQRGQGTDEDRAAAAASAGQDQASSEAQGKKNKLLNKIPDEHKDKAKEQIQKVKGYAKDKFPKERQDQFIYRLKKVVVENQRHRDFQDAIEFFIEKAETYGGHAKNVASQGADQGLSVRNDDAFQQAEWELRTLLERFANNQPMQPIFDAVNQLYVDANHDEELRHWFRELDTYVRQVLQEPGYIMKDECDSQGRRLLDKGKKFWDPQNGKYAGHKDAVFDRLGNFFQAYADDDLNVQLGEDVKKLTKNLFMDSEGNLKYKPHLWNDIRTVILPDIAKGVGLIPIPRIEYTDDKVDLVIENLTLELQNMLPNVLEMEARNYFKLSPYSAIKDVSRHSFWVSFSQIQADIKDVAFYMRKKSGFPKLTDSGIADVVISGKGISGKIHVESTGRKDHAFKIIDVNVKIDKLKFAVRESKFSFIISALRPLVTGLIKKAVAKAIQEGIRAGLVQLDAQIADISERLDAAKQDDSLNMVDRYKTVYNDKKEQAAETKAKAEDKAPSGQFQVTTSRDTKLVDWSSKHSAVEMQGKKQDIATSSHHGWKSPAFDIVGRNAKNPATIDNTDYSKGSRTSNSTYGNSSATYGNSPSTVGGNSGSTYGANTSGNYGSNTASGNYGSNTTSGNYGSNPASGNYGSNTTSGYGDNTTSGNYGGNTTSGNYGGNTGSGYGTTTTKYENAADNYGNSAATRAQNDYRQEGSKLESEYDTPVPAPITRYN